MRHNATGTLVITVGISGTGLARTRIGRTLLKGSGITRGTYYAYGCAPIRFNYIH